MESSIWDHHEHEHEPMRGPEHHVTNPEPEHVTNLSKLPEKCILLILSFTTPRDVCRLAAVSTLFRSAAMNSETVWNKFLLGKCDEILSKAVFRPIVFSSKKELYFRLCDSILIDGRRKRFWLERSTAKIAYMLSAIDLIIIWGNDQRYWRWVYREDSRFGELPELKTVWWLEIWGEIDCRLLSGNTDYRVLFVLKLTDDSVGWNRVPIKFSVTTPEGDVIESEHYFEKREGVANDGWMEVVAGEFRVRATEDIDDDSCHIGFRMKETSSSKGGLLIDGVKIEPKST